MNKALLIGNVGKDPEVRYYEQDQAVAQVVLATTERGFTLQNGTQVPDRTEWHNVVFYRGMAKVVEKYVRKGDKLFVEGKIRSRSYDDQKGVRRYVTEIVAENMEMLSPKGNNGNVSTAGHAVSEPAPTVQQEEQVNGDMPF
ncbi:MAG: single-stranded DNA-binding protein [Prevotella sp.]|nr:single-stranded DNA-binding protein [Prevotella sp.]